MKATRGNRIHIGIYGRRNVGKSTIFNLILGQNMSIVSDVKGTTTDSVVKSMELDSIGPVTFLDTAGYDDKDLLGSMRVGKTKETILKADCMIFVLDNIGITDEDKAFLELAVDIPKLFIINKKENIDFNENKLKELKKYSDNIMILSAMNSNRDNFLKELKINLSKLLRPLINETLTTLPCILEENDIVILVIPIDKEAPKGRLILPQVQVIRDLIDESAISVISGVKNLDYTLSSLKKKPKLVITDSQAFCEVSKIVPNDILLTSFSCLFANLKGDIKVFIDGAQTIDKLKDGDKILILESCTHHAIEDDIGKVKIPNLIRRYTGKNPIFEHYSGCDFPKNIENYALIIHCGACMTNRSEIINRIKVSKLKNIPITNYGIIIAKCLGILKRATEVFNATSY